MNAMLCKIDAIPIHKKKKQLQDIETGTSFKAYLCAIVDWTNLIKF